MKYIIGSFIISFGILFVIVTVMAAVQIKAPANVLMYLGGAWVVLSALCYPLARKLVR